MDRNSRATWEATTIALSYSDRLLFTGPLEKLLCMADPSINLQQVKDKLTEAIVIN